MRKLLILLLFVTLGVKAQIKPDSQVVIPISGRNVLVYVPWDYNANPTKHYPTICYFHGNGEGSTDPSVMLTQGLPYVINEGHPPYALDSNGDTTRFAVVSVQSAVQFSPSVQTVLDALDTLENRYGLRVDGSRTYATGLSSGGQQSRLAIPDAPQTFSAAVCFSPISVQGSSPNYKDRYIWFMGGNQDSVTAPYSNIVSDYNAINADFPGHAIAHEYSGGHCCWIQFYEPTWVYTTASILANPATPETANNMTIYQWMLAHDSTTEWNEYQAANQSTGQTTDTAITINKIKVDFIGRTGWDVPGWNSVLTTTAGTTVNNLLDTSGNPTSISVDVEDAWNGSTTTGMNTGNNSGIYPDSVMQTNFWSSSTTPRRLLISGLDDTKHYSFHFFSSRSGTNSNIVFTAGSVKDSVNGDNNTTMTADLDTLQSTGGSIEVDASIGSGSTLMFLNALVITQDSIAKGSGTPPPADTADYQIKLDANRKFYKGDTVFYQINDLTALPYGDTLVDNQNYDPLNGDVPVYNTTNIFFSGYSTRIGFPAQVVIDLGGYYKLTHEFIDFSGNTANFCMQYGSPGHWSDTIKVKHSAMFDVNDTIYTRYLKVFYDLQGGYEKARQIYLYGHFVRDSLTTVTPTYTFDTAYGGGETMGNFMGVNIAGVIPAQVRSGLGGIFRDYTNQYYLDTTHVHNIDSAQFMFSRFSQHGVAINYYFPSDTGGEKGPEIFAYTPDHPDSGMYGGYYKQHPPYFLPALMNTNQMEKDSGWTRTIDYTLHPNADSADPNSYDRLSRMLYDLGIAFGENRVPWDSVQYIVPDSMAVGNAKYIETGNENNGGWLNQATWYGPHAWIAYNSAFYDGNNGLMGSRMGVKNADSSIQVVMGGNAYSPQYTYMKSMRYWAYYKRPDHSIPFDIYNFHAYQYVKGQPHSAFMPEDYHLIGYKNMRDYWQTTVNESREMCPRCLVWNTEWGYDRNRTVENAVPIVPGQDSTQVQANWIARAWVLQSFVKGLSASVYYMLTNANSQDYDVGATTNYSTCGLLSGAIYGDPVCCTTNFYAYPAYYFQHTIYGLLYNYIPDSIVYENQDSLYVYKYRSSTNPDSVCYILWSGTMTNRIVDSFAVQTGHTSTPIRVIRLMDKKSYGDTTNTTSESDGTLPLVISETPQMVFTTDAPTGGALVQTTVTNQLPTANAGPDQTLNPSAISTTLTGSGTDNDGTIASYHWTTSSGAIITSPNSATTTVTGLVAGNTYTFTLTVTDNSGGTGSDNVTVAVKNKGPRVVLYIKNGRIILIQ